LDVFEAFSIAHVLQLVEKKNTDYPVGIAHQKSLFDIRAGHDMEWTLLIGKS